MAKKTAKARSRPKQDGSSPQPERISSLEGWSAERLSVWLLKGFGNWLRPRRGQSRANAFYPLVVQTDKDIVFQLEQIASTSVDLAEKLYDALGLAFERWSQIWSLDVLGRCFGLASHIGAKELHAHALRLVRDPRVTEADPDERHDVLAQMISALAGAPWRQESEAFIEELDLRHLWSPEFAGAVMLGRIKADPNNWRTIALDALGDLTNDDAFPPDVCALVLEKTVRLATLRRVVDDLPLIRWLPCGDTLLRRLFLGSDPVLTLPNKVAVRCAELNEFWDRDETAILFSTNGHQPGDQGSYIGFYAYLVNALLAGPERTNDRLYADIARANIEGWDPRDPRAEKAFVLGTPSRSMIEQFAEKFLPPFIPTADKPANGAADDK